MRKILFSMFLFAFVSTYAQQITIDTSWTSDEPGVVEQYWHWAAGVNVVGEGFTPSSQVTIVSKDPNGWAWREFTTTSDANGAFSIYVNAMKLNSITGIYTAMATDAANVEASATYQVVPNASDTATVTVDPSEVTITDLHYGNGIVVSATGLPPNAEFKMNLQDPAANGMEIEPTIQKFADANGEYSITLNSTTMVGTNAGTFPIPQVTGVWGVSFVDFANSEYGGSTDYRVLPDNLGEYCIPMIAYEAEPISKVEFSDLSKTSSLTSTEGYEDFTEEVANVEAGETYTIKLQGKAQWSWNANTYTVFIDWNQNGILDEEGEVYSAGFLIGSTGEDGQQVEYDITIPEGALNGETRMRILKVNSPSSTAMFWPSGACGAYSYGQIEDYTVNVSGGITVVPPADLPYNYGFETADFDGWTFENAGAGNDWIITDEIFEFDGVQYLYPSEGDFYAAYEYNSDNPANAWLFSRGLNLNNQQEIVVEFDYKATGDETSVLPEKMKVFLGNEANSAAQTIELWDNDNIENYEYETAVINYTPTANGVFYLGFQAYSEADQFNLSLDNVKVYVKTMSVSDLDSNKIAHYPNPVKDVLNIVDTKEISSVAVFDLSGKQVFSQNVNNKQTQINVSNLPTGIYIVKANVNGEVKTFKIVKK